MSDTVIKIVVGLGNPGRKYVGTRHNTGFKVANLLADALDIKIRRRKFGTLFGEGNFAGKNLILLKPMQFMNCSGQAVATAVGFYKLSLRDLLVVTDDMDLEPGRIRIRAKGSAGGHNGLADIIEKLGTGDINRLRIGIGRSNTMTNYDYVLSRPTEAEKLLWDAAIQRAREAVFCWVEHGIDTAMSNFNSE